MPAAAAAAVGDAAPDDPMAARSRRAAGEAVARVRAADVSAERAEAPLPVAGEAEVVENLPGATAVVDVRVQHERRAVGPAARQLGGDQLLVTVEVLLGHALDELAERGNVLLELAVDHEGAVARERRQRRVRQHEVLVAVAEHELAGLERAPAAVEDGDRDALAPIAAPGAAADGGLENPSR